MIKKVLIGLICCLPYIGAVQAADSATTATTAPAAGTDVTPVAPTMVAPNSEFRPKTNSSTPVLTPAAAANPSAPVPVPAPKSNPEIKPDAEIKPDPAAAAEPITGIPATMQPAAKKHALTALET